MRSFLGGGAPPSNPLTSLPPSLSHASRWRWRSADGGATRAVVGVTCLESPDPLRVVRFLVEVHAGGAPVTGDLVAEFSAEIVYPRLLIDRCLAVQADELALVVLVFYTVYTTGVHKKESRRSSAHGGRHTLGGVAGLQQHCLGDS